MKKEYLLCAVGFCGEYAGTLHLFSFGAGAEIRQINYISELDSSLH